MDQLCTVVEGVVKDEVGRIPGRVVIFGVSIANLSFVDALGYMAQAIAVRDGRTRRLYFVNTHTLNLASNDEDFRTVLNGADAVFGDGTGVRWAARARGVRMLANLNGTDLVPALFRATAGQGHRYFLLGGNPGTIERAAETVGGLFPGWQLAGFSHGYFPRERSDAVIDRINAARPNLLLVGMGNPKQEVWLHEHADRLRVPLCLGVGGLFDYWGGNLKRAPLWLRRVGFEWTWILAQQPQRKCARYLLGNPQFLGRMLLTVPDDLRRLR